jgi:signal transduction histidine kinase
VTVARRLADDVAALEVLVGETPRYTFESVVVDDSLDTIADELRAEGLAVDRQQERVATTAAWVDPAALRHALRNLVREVGEASGQRFAISVRERGRYVEILLAHDRAPITADVRALVFERTGEVERAAAAAGAVSIRLVAAQEAIEAMHGSLAYVTDGAWPTFVVTIPRADRLDAPVDAGSMGSNGRPHAPQPAETSPLHA